MQIYGVEQCIPQSKKLVPHLASRSNYVMYYCNLKQYLNMGMCLTRIHCVFAFHQSPWLKPYISLNTEKRKVAGNEFQKDFIFGMSWENRQNWQHVELVRNRDRLSTFCAKPSFKNFKIFSRNLVGGEFLKTCIQMSNYPPTHPPLPEAKCQSLGQNERRVCFFTSGRVYQPVPKDVLSVHIRWCGEKDS